MINDCDWWMGMVENYKTQGYIMVLWVNIYFFNFNNYVL